MSGTKVLEQYEAIQDIFGLETPFGLPVEALEGSIGYNIWARSAPKIPVLDHFVAIADRLGMPMNAYIDDLCARYTTDRSEDEQAYYNELYSSYFDSRDIPRLYSSEALGSLPLGQVIEITKDVSINNLMHDILPETKQTAEPMMIEVSHALAQLAFLDVISQKEQVLLSGRFSQGILNTGRQVIPSFPYVITADKLM